MGAWEDAVDRQFVKDLISKLEEAKSDAEVTSAWEVPSGVVKSIVLDLINERLQEV